ncbi:hypothetical protein SRABI128_05008 [Microbacterium sp. Bi128]|nr:hypothetical protein SRABI128_05008 [Microbacterium sp. Bi128]
MPFAELAHVEADHGGVVVEQRAGEGLGQLGLADAGGPEEQERAHGTTLVAEPRAVAAHGLRHRRDRGILPDHARVQVVLEVREAAALGRGQTRDRDAGGPADDGGDLGLVDDGCRARGARGLVEARLHGGDLVAQPRGLFVVLGRDGGVLVGLEARETLDEGGRVDRHPELQTQPRPRLVDEVDRLVGQDAVGQVPVAELDRGAQGVVGVGHGVVLLVGRAQAAQDLDRVGEGRLTDANGLQTPLQGGVLLDRAVLLERGGADEVQLTTGQARLQDVPGIHRPLAAGSRADDGVDLVDEHDELSGLRRDLVHRLGQPLLEVAPVAGAGEHRGEVDRHDAGVAELLGDVALDDRAGESLDDGGLADTGLTDEHGVVLGAAAEDLDRLLDLVGTADHGVEASLVGEGREIRAEAVEVRGLGCRLGRTRDLVAAHDGLAHALGQRLGGDTRLREDLPGGGVLCEDQREEQVVGVDVGRARGAGDLEGVEQRALHRTGDHRAVDVGGGTRGREATLGGARDRGRVGAEPGDGLTRGRLPDEDVQHVQRVEFALSATEGVAAGLLQGFLRTRAEEPAQVDGTFGTSAFPREVAREELVERLSAVVPGAGGDFFGQFRLL